MITFKELLEKASGQSAGKLELIKTSLKCAREYAEKIMGKYGHELEEYVPDFDKHYLLAKKLAGHGTFQRNQMPVISSKDVDGFIEFMRSKGVRITKKKVPLNTLMASQKQIYFDKGMDGLAKFGPIKTRNFLEHGTFFLISGDNYIIDGHHRYLTGLLFDPDMYVNVIQFNVPVGELLADALEYTDLIGNKRNL